MLGCLRRAKSESTLRFLRHYVAIDSESPTPGCNHPNVLSAEGIWVNAQNMALDTGTFPSTSDSNPNLSVLHGEWHAATGEL
jgi:hypothetical protein